MRVKGAIDKNQWFFWPCAGIINERNYYGYPVFALGFAFLCWRLKLEIGVRTWKYYRSKYFSEDDNQEEGGPEKCG